MKIETIKMHDEFEFLSYIVTDDRFLTQLAGVINPADFQSSHVSVIVDWCLEYHKMYKESPKGEINRLFKDRGLKLPEETRDSLGEVLIKIFDKPKTISNYDYAIGYFIKYLKLQSLKRFRSELHSAEQSGDFVKAESLIAGYKRIEKPIGEGVNIFSDTGKVVDAFIEERDTLFEVSGAVGKVIGKVHRGDFISCLAPMKRGKTHWMWWMADYASRRHLKVVFFTLEMTENNMIRRAWQSYSKRPLIETDVKIPSFIENDEGQFTVTHKEEHKEKLDIGDISRVQGIVKKLYRGGEIRIISLPAYSATVQDIDLHLENLQYYEEFQADVVVIDYADIIAPKKGYQSDYRHQLDDIWKSLRRLAQERNIAVITASQSDRSTFKNDIENDNVAEDIRKLAHVTCMVGLNQTKEEAKQGIMRISQIAIREGKQMHEQAVILQCLDIGQFCIDSKFESECAFVKEEKKKKSGFRK